MSEFQQAPTEAQGPNSAVRVEPSKTVSAHLLEELSQEIEHVEELSRHLQAAANRLIEPNLSHGEGDSSTGATGNPSQNLMNDLSARINRLREARERLESVNAQIERTV